VSIISGVHKTLQKSRNVLKIPGFRRVTRSRRYVRPHHTKVIIVVTVTVAVAVASVAIVVTTFINHTVTHKFSSSAVNLNLRDVIMSGCSL
jgi:hypothetical protein